MMPNNESEVNEGVVEGYLLLPTSLVTRNS